jgi:hypothetical protein
LLLLGGTAAQAQPGGPLRAAELRFLNSRLHGKVIDHTQHHGSDNRFWSSVLCRPADMYVYVPPGYDPCQRYPLLLWLHGYAEQDYAFPRRIIVPFDRAIACGVLPPVIIAAPSGHIPGQRIGSMFLNTRLGPYEAYVIQDVWDFLHTHYPIRPEREAHGLLGLSSSGWAVYTLAIRHRSRFGVVAAIMPFLNPRYLDCKGTPRGDFNPCCWSMRCELEKNQLQGIYYGYPITVRRMIEPLFGWGPQGLAWLSAENPIEVMVRENLCPGELAMFIGYIGRDQLHADSQIESFLHVAQQRGLCISVDYRPKIRSHTVRTGIRFLPSVAEWLGPLMAPYSPPLTVACPPLPEPYPEDTENAPSSKPEVELP